LADLRVRPGRSPKRRVILKRGPRYRDMKDSVRGDGIEPTIGSGALSQRCERRKPRSTPLLGGANCRS